MSFAEAVDFPAFASEFQEWVYGAWLEGLGDDGIEAVVSFVIPNSNCGAAWLKFANPLTNSEVDGGLWWYQEVRIRRATAAMEPLAGGIGAGGGDHASGTKLGVETRQATALCALQLLRSRGAGAWERERRA